MDQLRMFNSRFLLLTISLFLLALAFSQTCVTVKVDDRVGDFIKKSGPDKTPAELKALSIAQLRTNGSLSSVKLPNDSVKRIKIGKEKIKANDVGASHK